MKSQVLRIASLTALLVAGAWAQLTQPIVVDVPFDFTAGKTTLAAGEYQVTMQQPGVLRISGTDRKSSAMIITMSKLSRAPQAESRLLFNRYGSHYFLSQVWTAGTDRGVELPKTATEREVAQSITDRQDASVVARKR